MDGKGFNIKKNIEAFSKALHSNELQLDFDDTEIAFKMHSDADLKRMSWLFRWMGQPRLVGLGGRLALPLTKLKIGFIDNLIKSTIFRQFVGGTTLLECQKVINKLSEQGCYTILDYGAEAKTTESEYNQTMLENMRAIDFAAENTTVPIVVSKITGLARNGLLLKLNEVCVLSNEERLEYKNVKKRLDSICNHADSQGVSLFFDAEESWYQNAIDTLVLKMMHRYNKKRVVVYNTYQLYRKDKLIALKEDFEMSQEMGFLLGAKIVRGAYMEKERAYAAAQKKASLINDTKEQTDALFNEAMEFCLQHFEHIALCCATHNTQSIKRMAAIIHERKLDKQHPHLNFCQLYGMSDHLTFNLTHAGYNVAKYLPYGSIQEVVPYLIRRAQENTSIKGEIGRERQIILKEIKRRGA